MKGKGPNLWILSYGLCSILAGVLLAAVLLRVLWSVPSYSLLFPAYLVVSGIGICRHSRFSAELFLASGLGLLAWAIRGIIVGGLGRTELFGLLGSLIAVHGYWVLKQELAKYLSQEEHQDR